jgi:quercetin dioxygenase-like cupin family protein
MAEYTFIGSLAADQELPSEGILSRTVHEDDRVRAVLFSFAAGEKLTEHTAAVPAILYVAQGEAGLTLGADPRDAGPGTWVHMPPNLSHSIEARTPLVLMLLLLKQ